MARVLGIRSYRFDLPVANQRRALWTNIESGNGHEFLVEDLRINMHTANTGIIAVGDSTVTVQTGAASDGNPYVAGDFLEASQLAKSSTTATQFDLRRIFVVGTVAGDDVVVEYKSIVD